MKRTLTILMLMLALALAACSPPTPTNPPAEAPAPNLQPTDLPPAATAEKNVPDTGATDTATGESEQFADSEPETAATPACTPPAILTPPAMEGPYYTPGSPERTSLIEDLPGQRLVLTGYVLDSECQPIPGAWIDFWQADSQGRYDNTGYTLRGHQFTDEAGRYTLETVVPGQYPGRTEHLHVKVQAPGGPVLTTQLYFPSASQNQSDRLFDTGLLITVLSEETDEMRAAFNFVVNRR